ncbi:MAG TPA: MBL fold metallo-hydrolase [Planctomycetes bacterium]|nr:MBL fold metallo-hydrolase [Planctomycetota bacterium]
MHEVSETLAIEIVPVTPFQQNTTILRDRATGKGAIVDPGGEGERLIAACARDEVEVVAILLTHGHVDHAGAATELARHFAVPVIGPGEGDRFWLESLPQQAASFGLGHPAEVVRPDRWLEDGDTVEVGELRFEVLACPGHTPGHVVFFHRPSKLLIVGDVLFQGSIGRTDFPKGDYDTLIRSIQEKLLPLGDEVTFLPGHGPTSTLGRERIGNPFLVHPEAYRPG